MLGWWLLPLMVTIATFGSSILYAAKADMGGDFGWVGVFVQFFARLVASAFLSLTAWLVWAIAV